VSLFEEKCEFLFLTKFRRTDPILEKKVIEKREFALAKHETMHILQWMQKCFERHHGMQSSPHHFLNLLKFESKTPKGKLMSLTTIP
jgi:hypothetical protein